MARLISLLLAGLLFWSNSYAQQKPYGYKISGNGDIVSNVFFIQNGFVLDSAAAGGKTYRFEYNEQGKLKRDINFVQFDSLVGRFTIHYPGYRDYFYNERGDVDSVAQGHWNDVVWVADSLRYRIDYQYDNEGKVLLKTYSFDGVPGAWEGNVYDSSGNLISNTVIQHTRSLTFWDTMFATREYDSQNRLTALRTRNTALSSLSQTMYQYDASGNATFVVQDDQSRVLANHYKFELTFDQFGKLVKVTESIAYQADSTWTFDSDVLYNYDGSGRILSAVCPNYSHTVSYSYDGDGNLDSLANLRPGDLYPGAATLVDSYGNAITLPDYYGSALFYYSRLITDVKRSSDIATTYNLSQNYPNPFNPTTTIQYALPHHSHVTLTVYNTLGQIVAVLVNSEMEAGNQTIRFNGSHLASGVYFYRLQAGSFVDTKKLLLIR